jgi:hypothetical protein
VSPASSAADTLASATTGTATFSTPATGTSNVGSYAVTGSGLSANFGNYLFEQAPSNATALTINPATLTVIADSVGRIYGAANPLLSGSVTGFVGSDTLASATAGTETFSTPATGTSNVGSYAVTGSGLSANFGNYLFEQAPSNATALTINPATLTVIADSVGRTYGAANPLLSGSVMGFVGSDTLASATAGTETFSTPATSASNVGSYAVLGSGLSANFGNYLFAQAPANATALTINPATLTVTADSVSRIYGTANPLLSGSITGFVGSDTLASATTGTATYSTPATSSSNVGSSYAVTGSGLSANFGNYLFAQAPDNATALTISPATLIYSATPASLTTGQTPSGLSGTVDGFVAGDGLASSTTGTLAWWTPAGSSSPAGHYAINGSGLTATNYVFAQAAGNASALTLSPTPPPPEPASNPSSANAANIGSVPPPTPAASNLLATTELLTNVLASLQSGEPETPDLSPTITVKEVASTAAAVEKTAPSASNQVDVLTNIQGTGPTLYIVNGGTRLPANPVAGN